MYTCLMSCGIPEKSTISIIFGKYLGSNAAPSRCNDTNPKTSKGWCFLSLHRADGTVHIFISFPGSEHYILDTKNNGHVCGNYKNKARGTPNNTTKGWCCDPSECSHVHNYMIVQPIGYYQGLAFGFQHSRPGILKERQQEPRLAIVVLKLNLSTARFETSNHPTVLKIRNL